jgi:hypothetical protein
MLLLLLLLELRRRSVAAQVDPRESKLSNQVFCTL